MAIRLSATRLDMEDKTFLKSVLKDYGEVLNNMGSGSGTRDIDLTLGNVVMATVSGAMTTFSFSNPSPSGTACSFTLILINGGSQTVNWPVAVEWVDTGTAPVLNASGLDILNFLTTDAGTTWYGFVGGGLESGDTLWAWGRGNVGQLSQITSTANFSSPVQVGSLTTWSEVNLQWTHALALKTDGTLWTWGDGLHGSLGQITHVNSRSSPVQVGSLSTWSTISTGPQFSAALKTDGTLWTWGSNSAGRLGDNSTTYRSSPVQVGSLTTWSAIQLGQAHILALQNDGTMWSWGEGDYGRLGHSNNTADLSSPVQIGTLDTWTSIAADGNGFHNLAVRTDGTLWTWGRGSSGRLGQITTINNFSSPVQVGTSQNWIAVGAGSSHSFGIQDDGTLWAWGDGGYGKLGLSTTGTPTAADRSSPVQVGSLTTWVAATGGTDSSLGLLSSGEAFSWGRNNVGQIGENSATNRSSPVQIGSLMTWKRISVGYSTSLAIRRGEDVVFIADPGQRLFTASESYVVPAGVYSISAVCVGGGGEGSSSTSAGGGGSGGDLRYAIALTVTPGETLTITVGSGGSGGGTTGGSGGFSSIANAGGTLLEAAGGGGGTQSSPGAQNGTSTTIGGNIGGGNGGAGGTASGNAGAGGGGGGGGYSAAGGAGNFGNNAGAASTGGGGGGGGGSSGSGGDGGGGGGVGVLGAGANGSGGAGSTTNATRGGGGSSGTGGTVTTAGGTYGGGGGGDDDGAAAGNGGPGAVRIIWGSGRAYPSTNTADV